MKVALAFACVLTAASLVGCAGAGPKQAEGPRPDLSDSTEVMRGAAAGAATSPALAEAHAALEAKDFVTARARADAVLAKTPDNAEALFVLGVCDEAEKKDDAAVDHYKRALASDPKLTGASINLSAALVDQKRFDDAAAVARAGLEKGKGVAELHINLAYALQGKGDHARAAKSFGNAVALRPDDAELRIWHAQSLLQADDKDGAQRAFKNAIAKGGSNTAIVATAAIGLAQAGDAVGCVAALDKAVASGATTELLTERAICKHKAKNLAGARADLDAALAKGGSLKAHAAAAKYAEEAGDRKACARHYLETAKLAKGTKLEEEAKRGADRCK